MSSSGTSRPIKNGSRNPSAGQLGVLFATGTLSDLPAGADEHAVAASTNHIPAYERRSRIAHTYAPDDAAIPAAGDTPVTWPYRSHDPMVLR